jgi:hypothetical protein
VVTRPPSFVRGPVPAAHGRGRDHVGAEARRDATGQRLITSLPNFGYLHPRIRHAVFGRFPNTSLTFRVKEHIRHWGVTDFIGGRYVPWRQYPALFSPQLVYVLEPVG